MGRLNYTLFNFKYFRKVYIALLLLVTIMLIGVTGFKLIEGYTLAEAIYMTVITVSTVGFNEVRPLSQEGRLFTAILIIFSFISCASEQYRGATLFAFPRYRWAICSLCASSRWC